MIARQPMIGFTALDSTESSAVLRFNIRHGVEAVPGMSAAAQLRGRLEALTSCTFVRQSVVYQFTAPTIARPPAAASVSRVGVFIFATALADTYAIVEVPGLDDSHLVTSGPAAGVKISPDDPAVQAFAAELTSGRWCNPFGAVLVDLVEAFLQIRP